MAIRGCTAETIVPKLARLPEGEFHEATVPSFAAQAAFRAVARAYRIPTASRR
ncbi:hypothetical protein [Roseicella frigidaeris]|uniref:hypothetical protein n=1 Tax=Roseicella frigidaeris TaxID=2230885 RepID=UPI0014039F07|nr:hypothetical protein [Roseicella frigidaeris]